jgi:membrane protease YdiL (CAAX protease family)
MALLDTLDGMMMLWAYGWALSDPAQRFCFDVFVTGTSAFIALFVALVEVLGCIEVKLKPRGRFWRLVADANANFEYVGYGIIGFFVAAAIVAVVTHHIPRRPRRGSRDAGADDAEVMEAALSRPLMAPVERDGTNEALVGPAPVLTEFQQQMMLAKRMLVEREVQRFQTKG